VRYDDKLVMELNRLENTTMRKWYFKITKNRRDQLFSRWLHRTGYKNTRHLFQCIYRYNNDH
jgi:hypothetical protein